MENKLEKMRIERDNAEKREYSAIGRLNEIDKLLKEEIAKRKDLISQIIGIANFSQAFSHGPSVCDGYWEIRQIALEAIGIK